VAIRPVVDLLAQHVGSHFAMLEAWSRSRVLMQRFELRATSLPIELNTAGIRSDGNRRADVLAKQIPIERANQYELQLENVSDAIRGEATPLLDGAHALGQARARGSFTDRRTTGLSVDCTVGQRREHWLCSRR
jgi:hypothetical protein